MALTQTDKDTIAQLLQRSPTAVELSIFDTMWSEHCSYKSSKPVLKTLPTKGPDVLLGVGEDAGIVSFATHNGQLYGIAVSHESHNHPSQILPVEGAATGVGGVVRDVYCMGADVIGVLDSLHFGIPSDKPYDMVRYIEEHVVTGVADYGNPLGVPIVGGETVYHESYNENCLVNVAAVGIVSESSIIRSKVPVAAKSTPYVMVLIGKTTDSTGYGGASFSSAVLDSEDQNLGAVQVHDPFIKRVLVVAINAMKAYVNTNKISIGFKDLGAGGIACATSELAVAGGFGCELNLNQVPVVDSSLDPEIIACSETQERFCVVVPESHAEAICNIFNVQFDMGDLYPGAGAAVIGRVIHEPQYRIRHNNEWVCDLPVAAITTEVLAERFSTTRDINRSLDAVPEVNHMQDTALNILKHLGATSKKYVYRKYDQFVKGNSVVIPGEADACVLAPIQGCDAGVALTIDSNTYGSTDPYVAGAYAVAEAIRNVIAVGATPIALTDCLNYGNPENPDVFYDFQEGVRGISDAAKGCSPSHDVIPVISGNVSFYNESSSGQAIVPSPVICCIGKMKNANHAHRMQLLHAGKDVIFVGNPKPQFKETLVASIIMAEFNTVPQVCFDSERAANQAMLTLHDSGMLGAVHDVSQGGVWVSLVEMVAGDRNWPFVGVNLSCPESLDAVSFLFSENGGYLCEVDHANVGQCLDIIQAAGAYGYAVGHTTDDLVISVQSNGETIIDVSVIDALKAWNSKNIETPGTPIYNDDILKKDCIK